MGRRSALEGLVTKIEVKDEVTGEEITELLEKVFSMLAAPYLRWSLP